MKRIRFIVLIILACLATSLYAGTYRVTASQLNVRQQSSTASTILYKLQQGELVEGELEGDWIRIERDGIVGYASSAYLELIETVEPAQDESPKDSSPPVGKYIKWLIILAIAISALRAILKKYSLKSIIALIALTVLVFLLFPAIGKFLLGIIGLPKLGYYIGWGCAIIFWFSMLNGFIFDSDDNKSEQENTDYSEQPDYDYSGSQSNDVPRVSYPDYLDDDEPDDNPVTDYDERLREYEQQKAEEELQDKKRRFQENSSSADEWYYRYDSYNKKAKEAKDAADTYREQAKTQYEKFIETGDDSYNNRARDYEGSADNYESEYEKYQNLADEAYRNYEKYHNEAKKYDSW